MTVSHSPQMLLKLEKCMPISHVTLETVPKYANIERPTSSQLYASPLLDSLDDLAAVCSGYPLVSSKLAENLCLRGIYPLPLPLDQNQNWDTLT